MIINEKTKPHEFLHSEILFCLGISYWCKRCQSSQFKENFDNWTTGDKGIELPCIPLDKLPKDLLVTS